MMGLKRCFYKGIAWFLAHGLKLRKNFREYFLILQRRGIHLIPNHFYFPVPDTRSLKDDLWRKREENIHGLDLNEKFQSGLIVDVFPKYTKEFYTAMEGADHLLQFQFGNGSFERVDAEVLYSFVRHFKPKRVLEVGSGWSTLISDFAAFKNGQDGIITSLTAIDPEPRRNLSGRLSSSFTHIARPVQEAGLSPFESLEANDILFIDSSHVLKIGGDVQFLYLEVLPCLKPGVIVHVHDIFLPNEYPQSWIKERFYFWTEQYLLQAFLSFNTSFEVLWAGCFMHLFYPKELEKVFLEYRPASVLPGSFWFRRVK